MLKDIGGKNLQRTKAHWRKMEALRNTIKILGFSTTQIHYVFSEMGQSSLLCNLFGFGKTWVVRIFLVKYFLVVLDSDMLN